ncbi:MAG: hypothetical protein ABIX28_20900 [Vicinamibacterales bacterium]
MQCRNCGTEIADKAIICFRCGHATTDPVRKAVKITPRRSPLVPLVLIVMLAASGLYLGVEAQTAANPERFELAAGLCGGAALTVLLLTVLRRR